MPMNYKPKRRTHQFFPDLMKDYNILEALALGSVVISLSKEFFILNKFK